ncbi:MAG: glycosyltransferase [Phycisphaerales bacterium]
MRVLMLGWEFPPFITGGLGTACYGLTKALDRRGIDVTFVLPKSVDAQTASHVTLVSPPRLPPAGGAIATMAARGSENEPPPLRALVRRVVVGDTADEGEPSLPLHVLEPGVFERISILRDPIAAQAQVGAASAYASAPPSELARFAEHHFTPFGAATSGLFAERLTPEEARRALAVEMIIREAIPEAAGSAAWAAPGTGFAPRADDYSGDLISEADRYARFVVAACGRLRFDVVHAHDWLTYPAGIAIARVTGRPLVAHVHSTEFDRSGLHVNQRIYDIERRGMHAAMRVISVSVLTKNLCTNRYGVSADKIDVVYNGVDLSPQQMGMEDIASRDKIVLYFGRITMQKGPEYFVHAARRVLEVEPDVKFVVAGSGDQAQHMIELAASLGIGGKMLFTGFLRGKDIARVFAMADLYVMPSVSEPFGIAPLEAMSHDVPVLISKTSGVSEVLTHALKCDFWDVDEMANKIVAVLRHPPLSRTLREHGRFEVRRLTWDGAAECAENVYHAAVAAVKRR